ncbi:hypothetical protein HMSSN036_42690 [Paenibacillus macerans]|nr:hypothetical protein HMSSN036_42690 [Paenibacillus macerans]
MQGTPQLESLNDVVEPYKDTVVQSQLDLYSKDGTVYGLSTHVGATVAFYNTEILNEAGVDYKSIVTWDDFKKAGMQVHEKPANTWGPRIRAQPGKPRCCWPSKGPILPMMPAIPR